MLTKRSLQKFLLLPSNLILRTCHIKVLHGNRWEQDRRQGRYSKAERRKNTVSCSVLYVLYDKLPHAQSVPTQKQISSLFLQSLLLVLPYSRVV